MQRHFDEDLYLPHKEAVLYAIDKVFRRLLADLLLDFENPRFHSIRKANGLIVRCISGIPTQIVDELFSAIGFSDTGSSYEFSGTKEQVKAADAFFSEIEDTFKPQEVIIHQPKSLLKEKRVLQCSVLAQRVSDESTPMTNNSPFIQEDFDEVVHLLEIARRTLLTTGRVRNCFFEAKHFSLRRMTHGRVYACSEKCDNSFLEAHWHLVSGKNMLYAHVAHLSADGTKLLHLGHELGYQYNLIPGLANFGKTVNFSTKLISPTGKLVFNEHPNKVVENCIYCGQNLQKIFFC